MHQKVMTHKFLNRNNYVNNKIIQILTVSDGLFWSGNAAMTILVSVYLRDKISADPLQTIAIGFSIYMLAKSAFQIPVARFLDKKPTFIDETIALFISAAIMSPAFPMYQWIREPWHLYAIQTLAGFAASLNL